MAQRNEIGAVYAAGIIQGVALVTFPAASAIFSSPAYFRLSNTEYGGMFVPQAIMAIASSLMGAGLTRHLGIKRIFLLGLIADLLAMMFLVLSQFVMHQHSLAYGILLIATTSMGVGFGLTVPAINTFAAAFFPNNVDKAVLVLNALLGVGTALAPLFVAIFVGGVDDHQNVGGGRLDRFLPDRLWNSSFRRRPPAKSGGVGVEHDLRRDRDFRFGHVCPILRRCSSGRIVMTVSHSEATEYLRVFH